VEAAGGRGRRCGGGSVDEVERQSGGLTAGAPSGTQAKVRAGARRRPSTGGGRGGRQRWRAGAVGVVGMVGGGDVRARAGQHGVVCVARRARAALCR
jgi:hypothetical protein